LAKDFAGNFLLQNLVDKISSFRELATQKSLTISQRFTPLETYVNDVARRMGVSKIVLVASSGSHRASWAIMAGSALEKTLKNGGYSCIPSLIFLSDNTQEVLLRQKEKSSDFYLFRGFLAHELGHIKWQQIKGASFEKLYLLCIEESVAQERFADSCVPSDINILKAMRDFFCRNIAKNMTVHVLMDLI
jgi:hypothetical protein